MSENDQPIEVPFDAVKRIYEASLRGIPTDAIAVLMGCEESVIKKIIEHERVKAIRTKYKIGEEPA
jgi:hypothetical protein